MSQMNPKEFVHKTAYSVQLPYIAGHFFKGILQKYINFFTVNDKNIPQLNENVNF